MALKQRVITAIVLIPCVLSAIIFFPPYLFAMLMALVIALGSWEWAVLSGLKASFSRLAFVVSVLVVLCLLYFAVPASLQSPVLYMSLFWWISALILVVSYQMKWIKLKLPPFSRLLIGYLILVPAWWSMVQLRNDYGGVPLILYLLVLIWVADTAAYFSGKRWGRRRLASQVSPGKSWEGVICGLFAVLIVALLLKDLVVQEQSTVVVFALVSVLTAIFSVLGDLTESLVKRIADCKDSGNLLPGHGGIMDRIDSLTAATPVFLGGLIVMENMA